MAQVTANFPDGAAATAHRTPAEVARHGRVAITVRWYAKGIVSLEKGADVARLTPSEFADALAKAGVPVSRLSSSTAGDRLAARLRPSDRTHHDQALSDEFVRRILSVAKPLRIILFGSAARGEMRRDSDIDLLVVMPDGTKTRDCWTEVYGAIRSIRVPCDVIVATQSDISRFADAEWTVIYDALREGKELYRALPA